MVVMSLCKNTKYKGSIYKVTSFVMTHISQCLVWRASHPDLCRAERPGFEPRSHQHIFITKISVLVHSLNLFNIFTHKSLTHVEQTETGKKAFQIFLKNKELALLSILSVADRVENCTKTLWYHFIAL